MANDNPELFQYYYHSDHLGSTSLITDLDGNVVQHVEYVPYGEVFIEERNNTWNTPYLFNAKELDEETGLYYYGARYLDPRVSSWISCDRFAEKYPSLSAYSYCGNNPVKMIDVNGDSTVINNRGYILHYDQNDKDLRVFLNGKPIGVLGGDIIANGWFENLLSDNAKDAKKMWDPFKFYNSVKQYAIWDFKYRSPANQNEEVKALAYHILGIAFYRKDRDKGLGDLGETHFLFSNLTGRAEDLNNFNFGVIGKAYSIFSEKFLMQKAGSIEMEKWADDYKQGIRATPKVPESWRPIVIGGYTIDGLPYYELGSPYGDNPIDNQWIRFGFDYYKTNMK